MKSFEKEIAEEFDKFWNENKNFICQSSDSAMRTIVLKTQFFIVWKEGIAWLLKREANQNPLQPKT